MKKQIFLILMLTVFASANCVFGQTSAVHNSYPIPITCQNGPLSPIAGKSYNYDVLVNPTGGSFQWWATTNQNFMTATGNNISTMLTTPTGLLAASASYGVTSPTDNVDITWSSATLNAAETTPTFVVVQYDAPTTGCANNLKVYKIDPLLAFTVDIRNLTAKYDSVAYGTTIDTCASDIASAIYNVTDDAVDYDFGDNKLLFEVVLANFSNSATVSFSVTALGTGGPGDQSVDLAWGYTAAAAGTNVIGTDLPIGIVTTTAAITTNEPNTNEGVSIFVLATVNNKNFEGLNNTDFTLAVNATNAEGAADVVNTDCATQTNYEDYATQTINARPTVTDETLPAGDDFLPINN